MNALFSLKDRVLLRVRGLQSITLESSASTLARLPAELLLRIVSFLPAGSIACLSLTSKCYYAALSDQFDLKLQENPKEKQRFLRLLEEDLPEMMACYSCNALYSWKKQQRYLCPNQHNYTSLQRGSLWCFAHDPAFIYREMVDAFLRGFEKGPKYGPQLLELAHKCKCDGSVLNCAGKKIWRSLDARVIKGKLMLHGVHELCVSFPPLGTRPSQICLDKIVKDTLVPEIDKFSGIGCVHTGDSLPAVLLDTVQHLPGGLKDRTRCHDLLNCGHCATDLRVRIVVENNTCLRIEVEIWQSFGGRDPNNRDEMEDAHFHLPRSENKSLDPNEPPSRNLEELFKREVGESIGLPFAEVLQRRQSWLQLWNWIYSSSRTELCGYCVPRDDNATTVGTQERNLPVQCMAQ
jgi:hypothetical protein